jgi:hypothetical protein
LAQHPRCLGCAAVGLATPATVADHVVPHRGDASRFHGGELQPACSWHHDVIKRRLEWLYEQGKLGKSELWLNSKSAVDLSRRYPAAQSIDGEGWPTGRGI